jgi:small-conductance mechanosensitive channel/CRP-like cAMP-binding protein
VEDLSWAGGLFAGVILSAALINRFHPRQRVKVRRLVMTYALFVIALGITYLFKAVDRPTWAASMAVAAEVLQALTLISVSAAILFIVLLPAVRFALPAIATDLVVGIGSIAATLVVFSRHGMDTSAVFASGAVASAVLAISLQSTLGNILGGIALQVDGSIKEGDWIQLENGKQGKVRAVHWRHTVVETRNYATMIVPNAQLLGSTITILGKRDGNLAPQRMWVYFNVDFRFAPSRVIKVVQDAVRAAPIENVAPDPMPNVVCMDLATNNMMRDAYATYACRYWLVDLAADDPTSSRVRARIFTALSRAGIPLSMPPHLTVDADERAAKTAPLDVEKRLAILKTVHLFATFKEDELRVLAEGVDRVTYSINEVITRQGAVAHWLYVLAVGSVEIKARLDPDGPGGVPEQAVKLAQLDAPSFFGEMGLMTGEPRLADVIALGDVDCFRLGKDVFKKVLLGRPEIAEELSTMLANRRVELIAARDGLAASGMHDRAETERARILGAIKGFFSL